MSLELQKEPLGLWRHLADPTQSNTDLVNAPHGLFPAPLPPSDTSEATMRRIERFRLLGRVMAKALQASETSTDYEGTTCLSFLPPETCVGWHFALQRYVVRD